MMKKRVRLISMLLTLSMVITLLPVTVLAIVDEEIPILQVSYDFSEKEAVLLEQSSERIPYAVSGGNIYFNAETGEIIDCDYQVTAVNIPNEIDNVAVTSIHNGAFEGCKSLTNVTIPASITSIGAYAFRNCSGLTSIKIPNSVTSIQVGVFDRCSSLTSIEVSTGNANYCSENGVLFNKEKTELFAYPCAKQGAYQIPNSVAEIKECAFSGCSGLTNVTIPNSVQKIWHMAFAYCSSLTNVTIPANETGIPSNMFIGCSNLKEVIVSDGVAKIGAAAFHSCSNLTTVIIPSSVTTITSGTFYGCKSLKDVHYEGTEQEWQAIQSLQGNFHLDSELANAKIHYNSYPVPDPDIPMTVSLDRHLLTLKPNDTYTFIPTVSFAEGTATFVWSSSAPNIVSVDQNGKVAAVGFGEATITVTATAGEKVSTDTCNVTVAASNLIVLPGKTIEIALNTQNLPEGYTVESSSTAESVATVNGLTVTGVAPGVTTVVVRVMYQGKELEAFQHTVTTAGIKTQKELSISAGEKQPVPVACFPNVATITWESSDPNIVIVEDGNVIAKSPGTATLTAKLTVSGLPLGLSTQCKLTVNESIDIKVEELIENYVQYAESFQGDSKSTANQKGLGLTADQWCADFVTQCAQKVGLNLIIPHRAEAVNVYKDITTGGRGTGYYSETAPTRGYFRTHIQGTNSISVKPDEWVTIPRKGDIVVFSWNRDCMHGECNAKYDHGNSFDHVGLVKEVNGSTISVIHGNYSSKVCLTTFDISRHVCVIAFARPNYALLVNADDNQNKRCKITGICKCPIEVSISYNGEELNSASGQWLTSFGTMWREGEGVHYEIDYGNPYDYVISGTGEGTMNMTINFETDDGKDTRQFLNVPITNTTEAYVHMNAADMGIEMLVVDSAQKDEKLWYANPGETVTSYNAEMTEAYKQQDRYEDSSPSTSDTSTALTTQKNTTDDAIFTDVESGSWYESAVQYVYENGLMQGKGDKIFDPHGNLSRAELAQILYNKDGGSVSIDTEEFADVKTNAWYYDAVIWAAGKEIIAGYGNNVFGPDDPITREQLTTILYRYAGEPETKGNLTRFSDSSQVSNYAVSSLSWAVECGIISGKGNNILDPQGSATRAETAAILMRFFENRK